MKQHFEEKNARIEAGFSELKKSPERLKSRLNLSWSNWGFGRESLADSAVRLEKAKVSFIELHGNHYGPDLGYKVDETMKILADHNLRVSGVCGMFSDDNDLSSNRATTGVGSLDFNPALLVSPDKSLFGGVLDTLNELLEKGRQINPAFSLASEI